MASTGTSKDAKTLFGFFTEYLRLKHMQMEDEPPTINTETFDDLINTYHSNIRKSERITADNIKEFKQALQTKTRRVFLDNSTKIYKIINKGDTLYYHFSTDLQHLDRVSASLSYVESQNKKDYDTYEKAYDDACIIKQVVERDKGRNAVSDDFVKQITLAKSYYENKCKVLLIMPQDESKQCWKLVFSEDWTILVTLYPLESESKVIRTLYNSFKSKGKLDIPLDIKIYQKKKVPQEWFGQTSVAISIEKPVAIPIEKPLAIPIKKPVAIKCERCGGDIICFSHNKDVEKLYKVFDDLCDELKKQSKSDTKQSKGDTKQSKDDTKQKVNPLDIYNTAKDSFVQKWGQDALEKFFNLHQVKSNYDKCAKYNPEIKFKQKYLLYDIYSNKYLKYKMKYYNLKKQLEQ